MEKVKNFLTSVNFSVLIMLMIATRITVLGASIGDALAILAACGLYGFKSWLETQKRDSVNEELAKQLVDIKSTVSSLLIKNSVKPNQTNPDLRFF